MWRFLLVLLLVAGGAAGWAYYDYSRYLEEPIEISQADRLFTIESGWSAKRVSQSLASKGLNSKPHWFDLYARQSGLGTKIKAGEFILDGELTVPQLLNTFATGRTVQYSHTIIEGNTFKQVRAQLANASQMQQTLADMDAASLMSKLGSPNVHPEGQFFADTYSYPKNTTDLDYLKRSHQALKKVLQEEWENRAPDLPLESAYEALILASIVEKETAVAEERPLIAGVFHSRLRKKMRLQTDPTVIYGMGDAYDGNIRRKDLTTDTPYNTYTRAGLPPTPISMVGRDAINAALNPTDTEALYFVSRGDGTHKFSETLEQHNAAVAKYQLKRRSQ
ncbi:MAG: endolytic transglycosylase MltG [Gammaproteobacteria bacterium]|nr:endolytic transglycosylase MltG [Gammaproteobacteria bacterium]